MGFCSSTKKVKIAIATQQTIKQVNKKSSKNITPFGSLNFIYNAIKQSKSNSFIDEKLGYRNFRAHNSYSDIVLSLLGNSLCNGEYVSDLECLKNKFSQQFFTKNPSPDTVEYACRELKTFTEENELLLWGIVTYVIKSL